ncbi:MAG: T9SS type A sorting domain-containing protein, partial [Ferruginibacter sp.]
NVNTLAPGTYPIVITGIAGAVTQTTTVNFVVSPGAAPVITSQPVSQTVCTGANAAFTVAATGATIYQWQVSTNGGVTFTNIAGANGTTYTLSAVTLAQNNYLYHVVLSTLCGTVTSANAMLIVNNSLVAIITQPENTQTCIGDGASLSVSATSPSPQSITYQWQVSVNGGVFTDIPGATSSTLSVAGTSTNNGNRYRVVVSGPPCGSVTSNSVSFTVNQSPVAALAVNGPTSINPSIKTNLVASATPASTFTYIWFRDGILIQGETANTITVDVDGIGSYTVKVSDANTGCSSVSNSVSINFSQVAANFLFIYPNPSDGNFQVRNFTANTTMTTQMIIIYDSKGSRVYQKVYPLTRLYERMDVQLLKASAGLYLVDVRDAAGKRVAIGRVMIR